MTKNTIALRPFQCETSLFQRINRGLDVILMKIIKFVVTIMVIIVLPFIYRTFFFFFTVQNLHAILKNINNE